MNTGSVKFGVFRRSVTGQFSVAVMLCLSLLPQQVFAKTPDTQFRQYLTNVCNAWPIPASWDVASVDSMCQLTVFSGSFSSGGGVTSSSSNVGTATASNGLTTRKKKMRMPLDEKKTDKGASADGGGWGLLVTPQYSKTTRIDTDLENGYQSDLSGLVVGLDYRFRDSFVLGGTVGQTKDKAVYLNNAGSLKTSNNTFNLYGTWLPSDAISVDGYLGYGKLNLDSQRNVDFALIQGLINGSTTGKQVMAGLSTSYQTNAGRFSIGPFINLDYIKTSFKEYTESGSTVMIAGLNHGTSVIALHYFDRSRISLTSSVGGRVSTSYGYRWGSLVPSARVAAVHEFKNKSQLVSNELVATPGYGMSVATDALDCNYLISGLNVTGALNTGAQIFFDFEKRSQDRLLSSWAVSLGVLKEF
jgi:uncharacterized protein YhjY with autotransporter beta-barrel domain